MRKRAVLCIALFLLVVGVVRALVLPAAPRVLAQVQITNTPIRVNIATNTPLPTVGAAPTEAPPTFTPTEPGAPQLSLPEGSGEVNVRAEPDPESQILGTLRQGQTYDVTGQYFLWYQLRFDSSPTGRGFVFGDLVQISGDESRITDLSVATASPTEAAADNATATQQVASQTPGWEITRTAEAQASALPVEGSVFGNGDTSVENAAGLPQVLPTYTYPPNIPTLAPDGVQIALAATATPSPGQLTVTTSDGIAPIMPIVVLAGLGLLGLIVSIIRR
jgi:hypothetical protein